MKKQDTEFILYQYVSAYIFKISLEKKIKRKDFSMVRSRVFFSFFLLLFCISHIQMASCFTLLRSPCQEKENKLCLKNNYNAACYLLIIHGKKCRAKEWQKGMERLCWEHWESITEERVIEGSYPGPSGKRVLQPEEGPCEPRVLHKKQLRWLYCCLRRRQRKIWQKKPHLGGLYNTDSRV